MLCSSYKATHLPSISEPGDYLSVAIELQSSSWGWIKTCGDPMIHISLFTMVSQWVFRHRAHGGQHCSYKERRGRKRCAGTCATQMAVFKVQPILSLYYLGLHLARNLSVCLTSSKWVTHFSPTHDVIGKPHKLPHSIPSHLGRMSLYFPYFLYIYFLYIFFAY